MDRKLIGLQDSTHGVSQSDPPTPPPPYQTAIEQQNTPPELQQHTLQTIEAAPAIAIPTIELRSEPNRVTCPICHCSVVTRVEYTAGSNTHVWALRFLLAGCLPCVCLPYLMNGFQTANHYCPNCESFIGSY